MPHIDIEDIMDNIEAWEAPIILNYFIDGIYTQVLRDAGWILKDDMFKEVKVHDMSEFDIPKKPMYVCNVCGSKEIILKEAE